jgi:pimeloyl-ACP methyl ester carboxylesterase
MHAAHRTPHTAPHRHFALGDAIVAVGLLLCLSLAAGCGRQSPTKPAGMAKVVSPGGEGLTASIEAVHLEGEIGPGALYSLDQPANWNGDLVIYLHGYTPPTSPVALPANGPIRDRLLAAGYAVAASSYSSNGYAVPEAVRQEHQLRALFVSRVGKPQRTFLFGVSLGGIVGLMLAEKYPSQYDGALLVSGVVGGTPAQVEYIADAKVLFDQLYPNVHLGGLVTPIEVTNFNAQVAGPVIGAVTANPNGLGILNLITRHPLPGANGQELVTSLLNVLGFQLVGAVDLLDRTHGHMFFDNQDYRYTGPLPASLLDGINAGVARFSASPAAEAWLRHNETPSGDLHIPVLTLHNQRDPQVPAFHEALLAQAVHAQGADAFLAQRQTNSYGHVNFTPDELVQNFQDMVHWVDTGIRPAP